LAQNNTPAPVVRFEGNQEQRKDLKKAWHHLITHSAHAKEFLKKDLKEKGDLTIRPTNHNAYYNSHDNSINVDPNFHPNVYTSNGVQPASTEIILGHELGHGALFPHDDGPNNMNNVNGTENPIRHDLGLPDRTKYELAPDNPQ
jgi:hypothetical protein